MARPTLPLLSDAPITAIDFGERKTDSAIFTNFDHSNFHNKAIHEMANTLLASKHFSG
jgi:hypothetical protein